MRDVLQVILGLVRFGVLIFTSYFIFYFTLNFLSSLILKSQPVELIKSLAFGLAILITLFIFGYLRYSEMSSLINIGAQFQRESDEYRLRGLEGKILLDFPDTLKIFEKGRVSIRIAKYSLEDSVFVEKIDRFKLEKVIIDKIRLATAMKVNLRESPNEARIVINRLNNNETQVIDTTKFSEWLFDIKPLDYGKINFVVSVSAIIKTEFGNQEIDYPVYEKNIEIFAGNKDKVLVFWNNHYWIVLGAIALLFLLMYKLIPNQSIIEVHMANSNQTNFWNAGSLGLVIYIITISSIGLFKMLEISLYFVPLVFVGTILIYAIFTAVSLRDNDKLSEENFLNLMGIAIKKIPPLNWLFKNNTHSV